ncbi:Hypothetical protein, putative, partial [Bodo saltans]
TLDTAFTATNAASARWTIDKALCNKYQPPPASPQSSTTGPSSPYPPEPSRKPQFHERKKEAVLLWDEDALDFSPILEALDPAASSDASGRGDVVTRSELLAVLRRPRRRGGVKGSEPSSSPQHRKQKSQQHATTAAASLSSYAMTPFLLARDSTAEAIDIVLRLEDVPSTPFIAAFTRTGKMFVMHRLTRQVEPTVAPINLESSVTAVASAERWNFGRSVPGLPAFASFLAVATASMRLHIVSCRSFSVRVAHHLPEPVHALVYCGLRHVLFGGTTSGSVVMWAVSEKGFCTMLARWQCQPSPPLGSPVSGRAKSVVALCISTAPLLAASQPAESEASPSSAVNNMMLVGYHDGSLVQLNLALLPAALELRHAVSEWKKSSEAGLVDVPARHIAEDEPPVSGGDAPTETSSPVSPNNAGGNGKRRVLLFRPRAQQLLRGGGGANSTATRTNTNTTTTSSGPVGDDDPEAAAESIVFVGFSRALGQLISVASSGNVTLFPKDFPSAPYSVFQDPSRRLEDRIVFACLDTDGTAVVLCDYSTNLTVVSLVSLTVTWKRQLQLAVVDGLAQRGRVGVMGENPLHSVPRCFCGMSLSIGAGSGGVNVLLINTSHGCCVILLDSASDPSSGAVFAKDSDDLLICERLVRNEDILVMSSPHQFCLYDTTLMDRARFISLDGAPEALVHPAVRRTMYAQHQPLRMSAMCVSLDGLRLYVGCGSCVTVARLDTGRALWRYGVLPPGGGSISSIVCGGIGNVPGNMFLCLTSQMQLVQCAYEPHVFDEFRVYPPMRTVSLLGAPKASLVSPLSCHVDTLLRLPGRAKAYWYVSADGKMSFSRWDVKLGEWAHDWVTTDGVASKAAGNPFAHVVKYATAAHGVSSAIANTKDVSPPPLCELRPDDSVFTSKLLSPLPMMCVGTLQGELLLIVTRPHPQRGECVARWRQQNRFYHSILSSEEEKPSAPGLTQNSVVYSVGEQSPRTPTSSPGRSSPPQLSSQQPAVTSVQFVPPFSLYVSDAKGAMCLWNIADVVLQLRLGSVLDSHKSALVGTNKRCFVHPVPRPPIVRFVGVEFVDEAATITQSFYSEVDHALVTVDQNSRVFRRPLMLNAFREDEAAAQPPPHRMTARATVDEDAAESEANKIQRLMVLMRKLRAAVHVVRCTWRLSKSFQETQPGSDVSSMMEASSLVQQSFFRGGGGGGGSAQQSSAFTDSRAVIVAVPQRAASCADVSSHHYANHRTQSLRDVISWDWTFDHEGVRAESSTVIAKATQSKKWGMTSGGSSSPGSDQHRSSVHRGNGRDRFQQAAGSALEASRSGTTEAGIPWNPFGASPKVGSAAPQRKLAFKLRQTVSSGSVTAEEQLRGKALPQQRGDDMGMGALQDVPGRSGLDVQRQRECFGFDPKTDPSYHTMKRQVSYMGLTRPTRMALALTFVPRIVHPESVEGNEEPIFDDPMNDHHNAHQSVMRRTPSTVRPSCAGGCCSAHPSRTTTTSVVADLRKAWVPFCSLKDEVETAVPTHPTKLHVPHGNASIPYSTKRALPAEEAPKSLQPPKMLTRPSSAGPSMTSMRTEATKHTTDGVRQPSRRVGFVTLPSGGGGGGGRSKTSQQQQRQRQGPTTSGTTPLHFV